MRIKWRPYARLAWIKFLWISNKGRSAGFTWHFEESWTWSADMTKEPWRIPLTNPWNENKNMVNFVSNYERESNDFLVSTEINPISTIYKDFQRFQTILSDFKVILNNFKRSKYRRKFSIRPNPSIRPNTSSEPGFGFSQGFGRILY